jgi:hypothetical protein
MLTRDKMKKAFLLGCSHVSGSEIEGWGIGHTTPFNLANSFPSQFAKLIGYEPVNLGRPGASNDYIFRTFTELVESGEIKSTDIVIVFWTGEERIEIQDPLSKEWMQFSVGMATNITGYTSTHKEFYDLYQRLMCMEPMRGRLNKIKNIFALNYLAKLKGIEVINGDSFMEYGFLGKSELPWLFPHDSFTNWAGKKNYEVSPEWHHYGLDAHTDFAKECYKEYISRIMNKEKPNMWYIFLQQNMDKLNERNKAFAEKFTTVLGTKGNYDYNFSLDGWSSEAHWNIMQECHSTNNYLPIQNIQKDATVIFYNDYEGYCTDYIFDTIHWLIMIHGFNPERVTYQNLAANVDEMYGKYCDRKRIIHPIKVKPLNTFNYYNQPCYVKPAQYGPELLGTEKKLFISLNWNAWQHRLLLISILHYYDLIDDGNVSSPCADKFVYNKEKDFEVLDYNVSTMLYEQRVEDAKSIVTKLQTLKDRYPLKVDDRERFPNTDSSFMDADLKSDVFTARKNSLIEVVSETFSDGTILFGEKTFWPIMEGLPFIQLNSVGSLKHLHKLGYKTFSPYIDESYDDEHNTITRIRKISQELVRLKKMRQNNPDEFYAMYVEMKKIADYNRKNFYTTVSVI